MGDRIFWSWITVKYALIPLLPFAAFLVIGLFGHWIRERAHWIAVPAVGLSFLLAVSTFLDIANGAPIRVTLYSWITSGEFDVNIGFYIDRLTAAMLLLVTIVSGLVHVYTIGYMHGEPGYARFFAYIALFTFSMLMLVMADNFLQLYVFWEAVGLCSYLLIGHWYDRKSACDAATKAFVVNRVGDFGFGLGIMLIFVTFGSLQYNEVFAHAVLVDGQTINLLKPLGGEWMVGTLTVICLLLFTGAVGKSAQVPLHVWLPDAMEGPTPISALIHAATMVTAGVFMVARLSPLYNLSPAAMDAVAVTGGVTAIFAATIALTQYDIKRVVAYSTVSQLGYMIMACGLGAYTAGMYHLLTHGAFKALLFLGCGSVIIALHHEQDMRRMGGLRVYMPVTYVTALIGSLALCGLPPFAGFFSKDSLIEAVRLSTTPGAGIAYAAALSSVFVTALYTFRMMFMTFHGEERFHTAGHADSHAGAEGHGHGAAHGGTPHESPLVVTAPLVLLAIPSVYAGWDYIEPLLFGRFFGDSIVVLAPHDVLAKLAEEFHGAFEMILHAPASMPFWLALTGVVTAWYLYLWRRGLPELIAARVKPLYIVLVNKYYFDEIYQALFADGTRRVATALWKVGDVAVIDGFFVNGAARAVAWASAIIRRFQSGFIYHYAFMMIIGVFVLLTLWFARA